MVDARKPWGSWLGVVFAGALVAVAPGCTSDPNDAVGESADALSATNNGAGAGPERFDEDPCATPATFAKRHGYNLIVMKAGQHRMDGTNGRDLIVGTPGDDVIDAKGGDDIVCAGEGEDTVKGGSGNDYIDGGGDNDKLYGDEGNDLIHGRGGSDEIHGGDGDDMLFGDILDDKLYGGDGDDLLVGGHGTDVLDGGPGNDYLRGDTGNDAFIGGAGQDVASFITAMPPGQGKVVGGPDKINGVKVDFTNECAEAGDIGLGKARHDGCANGDGGNEPLDGVEIVVGSPYDDVFVSDAGKTRFIGGYGSDTCDGKACGKAFPAGAANKVFVTMDDMPRDTGLVIVGTPARDVIDVVRQGNAFRVRPSEGTSLFPGPGCRADGAVVECTPKHVLRHVAAWMGDGDDTVRLAEAAQGSRSFPLDMTAHVNGGEGDDRLFGGDEQDVFFSGPTGKDHLFGNNGDDALLSESQKWKAKDCSGLTNEQKLRNARCTEDKPNGDEYTDGADELFGGQGNDQLVVDYPCGGHVMDGGPGKDIAGFARSGRYGIKAQLGGKASKETAFHGRAFNPELCEVGKGTHIAGDLEILEAADGDDELWGNDDKNWIWGREGNDEIHGLGGDDVLDGLRGDDNLYGGAGNDDLNGHSGNNQLFQDAP